MCETTGERTEKETLLRGIFVLQGGGHRDITSQMAGIEESAPKNGAEKLTPSTNDAGELSDGN